MKKYSIILLILVLSSCSVYTQTETIYGSITTFTQDGNIFRKWDNVIISETTTSTDGLTYYSENESNIFKNFGLNFYDVKNKRCVAIGNIPYIIEYSANNIEEEEKANNIEQQTPKTESIAEIKDKLNYIKKTINKFDINSEEYNKLQNEKDKLIVKLDSLYKDFVN